MRLDKHTEGEGVIFLRTQQKQQLSSPPSLPFFLPHPPPQLNKTTHHPLSSSLHPPPTPKPNSIKSRFSQDGEQDGAFFDCLFVVETRAFLHTWMVIHFLRKQQEPKNKEKNSTSNTAQQQQQQQRRKEKGHVQGGVPMSGRGHAEGEW